MADFKIDGRMKVKKLKELFANEFGGTLRVYNGKKLAEDDATLASIRSNDGAKGGEFTCRASRTVGKFEQEIWDVFGIKVQVATCDDHVLVLDGITLSKVKDIPKYASKESMEEFLSYKRKAKDGVAAETEEENTSEASSNLKKYTIRIKTKGAHNILCGMINIEEDVDEDELLDSITTNDVDNNFDFEPHDGLEDPIETEYIMSHCIGDEYEGAFELEVVDEDENEVYTTDNFYDVKRVDPEIFIEDAEEIYDEDKMPDEETLKRMHTVMLEKAEDDLRFIDEGYCVVVIDQMKWQYMTFEIEDTEFDINKLLFVYNPALEGASFDSYTDQCHVMYGEQFLENIEEDNSDDYGMTYYLAKRTKKYFEIIRELDEE